QVTENTRDRFRINGSVFNGNDYDIDGPQIVTAIYREDGVLAGMSVDSIQVAIPAQRGAAFGAFSIVSDMPGMQMTGPENDYTFRVFVRQWFDVSFCDYEFPAP